MLCGPEELSTKNLLRATRQTWPLGPVNNNTPSLLNKQLRMVNRWKHWALAESDQSLAPLSSLSCALAVAWNRNMQASPNLRQMALGITWHLYLLWFH